MHPQKTGVGQGGVEDERREEEHNLPHADAAAQEREGNQFRDEHTVRKPVADDEQACWTI